MPFKKGQSGNPQGKPKGIESLCTKVKNDMFKAYEKMGGLKGFMDWLSEKNQKGKLVAPGRKADFYLRVLPTLMPKKTDIAIEEMKLVIQYLDGPDPGPPKKLDEPLKPGERKAE